MRIWAAAITLFGLAAFTVAQRTKEIGIRKVMGASIPGIVLLITKDFAALVFIAILLGTPIAYYGMSRWLQDFAYRIEVGFDTLLLAGSVTLFIALTTVSYQSLKAALANPVEALRYE